MSQLEKSFRYQASQVAMSERSLTVDWMDGHHSRFHYVWLRDNCECPECGHGWGKKFVKVVDIPNDIRPTNAKLTDEGQILVQWRDGHVSTFATVWLRDHCYSTKERERRRHKPILWDASLGDNLPIVEYDALRSSDEGLLAVLEQARDYGFSVIRRMPNRTGEAERLGEMIGPLRENNYGRVFDVQAGVGPDIAATQTYEIEPHCDDAFRYNPPGLTIFHCIQSAPDKGGATWLTDGFSVAEAFRAEDPGAFDILTHVPQMRRRWHEGNADLRSDSRVINVDFDGNVVGVRFVASTSAPLDLPFDLVEPYYAALRRFVELGLDERFRIELRLEPGDCVVFDNHRVTHGRSAFSGPRHMQLVHLDREDFHSKLRILGQRLGREDVDLVLPRGALT